MEESIGNKMGKVNLYNKELLEARKKSLASFSDMDHRLESLGTFGGVEWINDSKATDLESAHYALSLFKQPVIWIVESSDLDRDYSIFEMLARYSITSIVCYGKYETNIKYTLGGVVANYAHKETLEEAVLLANDFSKKDHVVLFSPACPTDSRYSSYRERGEEYKRLVLKL